MLVPPERFGVKIMSVGFLIEEDQPVVWRGPMVSKAIMEFLGKVAWGELDYLVVDLPPGMGDPSITIARALPRAGVVIVTTPQSVALARLRLFAADCCRFRGLALRNMLILNTTKCRKGL